MSLLKTLTAAAFLLAMTSAIPVSLHHAHHDHDQDTPHNYHDHEKRGNTCSFPSDEDIVKLSTTDDGWAQDGACESGKFCQYACPPGKLMGQWNPKVTSYTYPGSQDGGVYCNNGKLEKKNKDNDYCYDGKGTAKVNNKADGSVAFCQTVLPGSESMLIPTEVGSGSSQTLAVPGTDYWSSSAAHYYINPPGVSADEGCVWGSTSNPYGNWAPYVAGFNMDDDGKTYGKIGWNPIYFEDSSPFSDDKPKFGIKMSCKDDSKCSGDSCEINPKDIGLNKVSNGGNGKSDGAAYCVLSASDSSDIVIEVFDT
ncbi:unnamed protein product [Ambrosiozyma monospora]|uniref:Unnamed protein product n=1 Tax=Ambrosiozyma monospora TaxID=43982 RepID=A0ACB5SRU7_AMBMO|nr:unnamed protein product [Ambrosiozyma monospora]